MGFYNNWALRILKGQWTDHQAFYGLPGYAFFLAAIYSVIGYTPFIVGLLQTRRKQAPVWSYSKSAGSVCDGVPG